MKFTLNPSAEDNVTWFENVELKKIQVNCAQLLRTWTNDENKALYQVIIKQKQKLITLKEQSNRWELMNENDHSAVNDLTQALEKEETKLNELQEKNRKIQAENNELKATKKRLAEECKVSSTEVKNKGREVKELNKTIKELNSQIASLSNLNDELKQKLTVMEEIAGDVGINKDENVVFVSPPANKDQNVSSEKLMKTRNELSECMASNARLETDINELEKRLKWTNDSYQEIISNKDKSISLLTSITEEDNVTNKYKMLLMHYKSELEMKNIMEIKQRVVEEKTNKDKDDVEGKNCNNNNEEGHSNGKDDSANDGGSAVFASGSRRLSGGESGGMSAPDSKLMKYIREGDTEANADKDNDVHRKKSGRKMPKNEKVCWAFDKCTKEDCQFTHKPPNLEVSSSKKFCYFAWNCTRDFCPFVHPKGRANPGKSHRSEETGNRVGAGAVSGDRHGCLSGSQKIGGQNGDSTDGKEAVDDQQKLVDRNGNTFIDTPGSTETRGEQFSTHGHINSNDVPNRTDIGDGGVGLHDGVKKRTCDVGYQQQYGMGDNNDNINNMNSGALHGTVHGGSNQQTAGRKNGHSVSSNNTSNVVYGIIPDAAENQEVVQNWNEWYKWNNSNYDGHYQYQNCWSNPLVFMTDGTSISSVGNNDGNMSGKLYSKNLCGQWSSGVR